MFYIVSKNNYNGEFSHQISKLYLQINIYILLRGSRDHLRYFEIFWEEVLVVLRFPKQNLIKMFNFNILKTLWAPPIEISLRACPSLIVMANELSCLVPPALVCCQTDFGGSVSPGHGLRKGWPNPPCKMYGP